jgi:hypothetical protein
MTVGPSRGAGCLKGARPDLFSMWRRLSAATLGALSRRGAVRVLALGPTVPPTGTYEPVDLFGRPPASTQLRARQGNRANSNRCVAPLPQTAPESKW